MVPAEARIARAHLIVRRSIPGGEPSEPWQGDATGAGIVSPCCFLPQKPAAGPGSRLEAIRFFQRIHLKSVNIWMGQASADTTMEPITMASLRLRGQSGAPGAGRRAV